MQAIMIDSGDIMGQVLHASARTTVVVHRAGQRSEESVRSLAKPNHPWTNGHVGRMNRPLIEATVKRYNYDSHDQLR